MGNSRTLGAAAPGQAWSNSDDGLPLALIRARESIVAPFRHLLRRYNLTEPQWRVLQTIADGDTVELSELARTSALMMPSLSRIVRELEERGYLTKAPDPRDMRRMLAVLTDRGRQLVAAALPECNAVHAAIRTAMGSVKVRQLGTLLAEIEKLAASLDTSGAERPDVDVAPAKRRGRPRKAVPA